MADLKQQLEEALKAENKAAFRPKRWAVAIVAALWSLCLVGLWIENWWLVLGGFLAIAVASYLLKAHLLQKGVRQSARGWGTNEQSYKWPKRHIALYVAAIMTPSMITIFRDAPHPFNWVILGILIASSYPMMLVAYENRKSR